jgi:hypothetical protein
MNNQSTHTHTHTANDLQFLYAFFKYLGSPYTSFSIELYSEQYDICHKHFGPNVMVHGPLVGTSALYSGYFKFDSCPGGRVS